MIYVISNGKHLKIGFTSNINKRLATLQTASSTKLEVLFLKEGDITLEKQLQSNLDDYKVRGEWFVNCTKVLNIINKLPDYQEKSIININKYYFELSEWPDIKFIKEGCYGIEPLYIYKLFQYSSIQTKYIVKKFLNNNQRLKGLIPLKEFCDLILNILKTTQDLTARKLNQKLIREPSYLPFMTLHQFKQRITPVENIPYLFF